VPENYVGKLEEQSLAKYGNHGAKDYGTGRHAFEQCRDEFCPLKQAFFFPFIGSRNDDNETMGCENIPTERDAQIVQKTTKHNFRNSPACSQNGGYEPFFVDLLIFNCND